MAISLTNKAHGAALFKLFECLGKDLPEMYFSLETGSSNSAYLLNGYDPKNSKRIQVGLFIKLSNKRASPWRYSYYKEHQDEIAFFKEQCGEAFSIFVNGDDGFACMDFEGLKEVLDDYHEEQEWVSISRKPKQAYRVNGNDGKLDKALPINSFPGVIIRYFEREFNDVKPSTRSETFTLRNLVSIFSKRP